MGPMGLLLEFLQSQLLVYTFLNQLIICIFNFWWYFLSQLFIYIFKVSWLQVFPKYIVDKEWPVFEKNGEFVKNKEGRKLKS